MLRSPLIADISYFHHTLPDTSYIFITLHLIYHISVHHSIFDNSYFHHSLTDIYFFHHSSPNSPYFHPRFTCAVAVLFVHTAITVIVHFITPGHRGSVTHWSGGGRHGCGRLGCGRLRCGWWGCGWSGDLDMLESHQMVIETCFGVLHFCSIPNIWIFHVS